MRVKYRLSSTLPNLRHDSAIGAAGVSRPFRNPEHLSDVTIDAPYAMLAHACYSSKVAREDLIWMEGGSSKTPKWIVAMSILIELFSKQNLLIGYDSDSCNLRSNGRRYDPP